MTGLEGDRAERSEVKTSQCDVFRESDKPIVWLITRRIKRAGRLHVIQTHVIRSTGCLFFLVCG